MASIRPDLSAMFEELVNTSNPEPEVYMGHLFDYYTSGSGHEKVRVVEGFTHLLKTIIAEVDSLKKEGETQFVQLTEKKQQDQERIRHLTENFDQLISWMQNMIVGETDLQVLRTLAIFMDIHVTKINDNQLSNSTSTNNLEQTIRRLHTELVQTNEIYNNEYKAHHKSVHI